MRKNVHIFSIGKYIRREVKRLKAKPPSIVQKHETIVQKFFSGVRFTRSPTFTFSVNWVAVEYTLQSAGEKPDYFELEVHLIL